ncbi:MAG: 3-isopropylmalate dehydratase small subunit [Nitrososphaera sp.]
MEPFNILTNRAVPLDRANVDTDQIVPKQFLKQVGKTGFGNYLFYDWRFDSQGKAREDFVLNFPSYRGRKILLTRENFGIGSSREHAVWALYDFGFRAVIAPSFADIFYANCFKSGLLPVRLAAREVDLLFDGDCEIVIDLPNQEVSACGKKFVFEVDSFRKNLLLEGTDTIGLTLKQESKISAYESSDTLFKPGPAPVA